MARVLVVVLLARLLAQSTGLDLARAVAYETSCEAPCDNPSGEGDCGQDCERCLCCAHHRTVTLPPTFDWQPGETTRPEIVAADEPVLDADPAEILDVPKRRGV